MPQHALISVRGEVVLEVEPEFARIEVSVAAAGADRASTLKLLRDRAAAVEKVLASFPDAIEKTETCGLRVGPRPSSRSSGGQVGYHGAVHHVVAVTAFDQLGELIAQLAEQDLTEVGGPWWELRPDSPAYQEARVFAASDAVRRARDYASALGSELDALVELADTGLLADGRSQGEPRASVAGARLPQRTSAAIGDELALDLTPARQAVRASVEARFTISQPDLAAMGTAGPPGALAPQWP